MDYASENNLSWMEDVEKLVSRGQQGSKPVSQDFLFVVLLLFASCTCYKIRWCTSKKTPKENPFSMYIKKYQFSAPTAPYILLRRQHVVWIIFWLPCSPISHQKATRQLKYRIAVQPFRFPLDVIRCR